MKKRLVIGLAIGLASVVASSVFAGPSATRPTPAAGYSGQKNTGGMGIIGSSHDMSNVAGTGIGTASNTAAALSGVPGQGGDVQKRICVFCHHPHNAMAAKGLTGYSAGASGAAVGTPYEGTLEYSPLWNRELSKQQFTGYSNGIMMGGDKVAGTDKRHALNATDAGGTKIAGVSLLCMSCHDGVVAMNAYSRTSGSELNGGTGAGGNITSTAGFKGDMNNHHPMGFNYQTVQAADAEIAATTTVMVPGTSTTIGDLLYGSDKTLECVTCHDVHNTQNQTNAERFLWRSNNESNFCLTCHLK